MAGRSAEPPTGYLSTVEAARRLGWSVATVRRREHQKELGARQERPGAPRFYREKLVDELARRTARSSTREPLNEYRERVLLGVLDDSSKQATSAQRRVDLLLERLGLKPTDGAAA